MAHNQIEVAAPPERVWEVLSDAACYPRWVVGAREFRGADEAFPAVGSRFHHRVGVGPLTISDHTEVLDVNAPWRIELKAKARPFGAAHVTLLVQPSDGGSRVVMLEEPADPITRMLPVVEILVGVRNTEALRRLKRLIER